MPLFCNNKVKGDEVVLYDRLASFFRIPSMVIRSKCQRYERIVIHTFRDKRSGNMVAVKDHRPNGGPIEAVFYHKTENIARNISTPYIEVQKYQCKDLLDKELYDRIVAHICSDSAYTTTDFRKIPATKKKVEDLTEDEVTVGRITEVGYLNTRDEPYYDLKFENNTGAYLAPVSEINQLTKYPIGKFVVINKHYNVAIFHPVAFFRYFEIVERDNQISRPAELLVDPNNGKEMERLYD